MKITFFVSSLGAGGAEKMMLRLATHAAKIGHSVELLLAREEGSQLNNLPNNVNIVILKKTSRIRGLLKIISFKKGFLKFKPFIKLPRFLSILDSTCEYLSKRQPELVISTLHTCNLASIMARECTGVNTKIIIRECIQLSSFIDSVPNREKSLLPYIQLLYPLADKVVSVAKQVEKDLLALIKLPPDISQTIYNPVIGSDFEERINEPVDIDWLNDEQTYVILGVGRLSKQKDFSTLINAFAIAKSKAPSIKLLILGEGEQRLALQSQINRLKLSNDVLLHGFVNNPLSYMSKADLFVLTSLLEGAPNVLVEAMATGCQIISTDSPGGSSELLHNGTYGALVPMKDNHALSEAIIHIYTGKLTFQSAQGFASQLTQDTSLRQYINSCFPQH
ncbi:MAG: hypothetical protein COB22_00085 [Cycloclasticus sp.]|nr:MAG: hypothetical protein COB22_00085 [Cycloclasticus sp.]